MNESVFELRIIVRVKGIFLDICESDDLVFRIEDVYWEFMVLSVVFEIVLMNNFYNGKKKVIKV